VLAVSEGKVVLGRGYHLAVEDIACNSVLVSVVFRVFFAHARTTEAIKHAGIFIVGFQNRVSNNIYAFREYYYYLHHHVPPSLARSDMRHTGLSSHQKS
jgi:hypothetical protein